MVAAAFEPLVPAVLEFNERGVPVSAVYQDSYHPPDGPLGQAQRVFLHGNGLPERWQGRRQFTICETGFGLGASFLASWQAWRQDPARSDKLHFVSVEAHPFRQKDLAVLYARLPEELQEQAQELLPAWPMLVPGIHRLELDGGRVTLTLAFGQAETMMRELQCHADAFYLDGFAPRGNPAMWSRSVLGQLVRLAAPGATAASWCCAGQVRRDLTSVGFEVEKVPGAGGKWCTIRARLRPHLGRRGNLPEQQGRVVVIGAGLAGAACAWELARKGLPVLVCDPVLSKGLDASHQGHRLAAISPVFALDDAPLARLSRTAVLHAWRGWKALPEAVRPRRVGTLVFGQAGNSDADIQQALTRLALDTDWVQWLDREQGSALAGAPLQGGGLYFPQGMVVDPAALVAYLLDHPLIQCLPEQVALQAGQESGVWELRSLNGDVLECSNRVVIAAADQSLDVLAGTVQSASPMPRLAAMQRLAGQVSYLPAGQALTTGEVTLSGQGYILPVDTHGQVIGSTYERFGESAQVSVQGHQQNLKKVSAMLADPALGVDTPESGWAGWRCALSDHLPVMGFVPGQPGLFMAAAYGSRGLSWSLLAASLFAAYCLEEPIPLERRLEQALIPR